MPYGVTQASLVRHSPVLDLDLLQDKDDETGLPRLSRYHFSIVRIMSKSDHRQKKVIHLWTLPVLFNLKDSFSYGNIFSYLFESVFRHFDVYLEFKTNFSNTNEWNSLHKTLQTCKGLTALSKSFAWCQPIPGAVHPLCIAMLYGALHTINCDAWWEYFRVHSHIFMIFFEERMTFLMSSFRDSLTQ